MVSSSEITPVLHCLIFRFPRQFPVALANAQSLDPYFPEPRNREKTARRRIFAQMEESFMKGVVNAPELRSLKMPNYSEGGRHRGENYTVQSEQGVLKGLQKLRIVKKDTVFQKAHHSQKSDYNLFVSMVPFHRVFEKLTKCSPYPVS